MSWKHWIPRGWTLVVVLLTAMMMTTGPGTALLAQVITTQVADTVYRADGSTATGTVVISWPEFTTATGQSVPAGSTSATIATGGVLSVQLAPNAGSNPMGSYYTVVYHLDDGSTSKEYWVVPASTSPVQVSAIRSTVLPASVAMQTVSKSYVDTAIAAAVSGVPLDSSTPYVEKAGDTMTGPLVLSGDPVSATQAADKNYVDTSVQAVAAGVGQKVSLVPQATQTVVQPTGSLLQVNNLNGVEYATQYVTGNGNNGIVNATSSTDCASGCEVKVAAAYNTKESYAPTTWNNQTHIEDARLGGRYDAFLNPGIVGETIAQTIDLVSTQNTGISGQTVVQTVPNAIALDLSMEAPTGGSNLFPQSIEPTVPYFKSNFLVQHTSGTFNTMGQHILDGKVIYCYGVGDCLIGAQFMYASGGFRDEADEASHPFDLSFIEDPQVFTGTCTSGCTTGSTSVMVTSTAAAGTQGEGRYLIDKNPTNVISSGILTGGTSGAPYPTAAFSGTSFPISVFFSTAQLAPSQTNNVAPGTVTLPIATSGVTTGFATNTAAAPSATGIACVVDQDPVGGNLPHNYEMATYTVVDGTHFQLALKKVHTSGSTIAIGGLCGYGLEQTVDTHNGLRQVFPVVGSFSSTGLYYAGQLTPIVGVMNQTSAYINVSGTIVSAVRNNNVVTLTASGNFAEDVNGLTMTVAGVTDSSYNGTFSVTTTSANTLTYTQTGTNSTSSGGTVSIVTGGFALYPMAEVLGVLNPTTKLVDGQMTLAPNTVAWATGDAIEQPHYYEEKVSPDTEYISQSVPRPEASLAGGINYQGYNSQGLSGWQIANSTPASNYIGAGGTLLAPYAAYVAKGAWQQSMVLDAGSTSVFNIHCSYHGCGRWNSTYDLFDLYSNTGVETIRFMPQSSILNVTMRGTTYQFTPQAFTAGTINATTVNATTINGSVSGNSITSGAVAAAYLPLLGASGTTHAPGIVPDPGATSGTTHFLREDGTWSVPVGSAVSAGLLSGASADYNFLQGSGTTITDSTGNGNTGTLSTTAAPTWTATGLAFVPGQGVSLPATLNGTQTYFMGLYINPLTAGTQTINQYPVLLSSSAGGSGFNFMYSYTPSANGGFISNAYAPTLYVNSQAATITPNLLSGFHVLAAVLGTGSGNTDHIYIDGVEVANYTRQGTSAGTQTTGNLFLGSSAVSPWATSGFNGTMYRLRTYATQLSASTVQSVSLAIANEIASRGVPVSPVNIPLATPQLQAIGDSITYGQGVTTPWPSLLGLTNQPAYTITDWGITGITLSAINGSDPNRAALRCHSSSGPSVAVVFAGTNDFAIMPTSATALFANMMGEVQTMKQAGCRVFVGTMLSRTGNDVSSNTLDSDKDAYDALILAQAKAGGADGIIDFAANPLLGADGANANTSFQSDHIHPTQAGQQLLANAASNALNYYFGYNETNPHVVTTLGYSMTAADGYLSLSGLTDAGTLTLPDCTGQSGAAYRINNPQSSYAVSVVPLNSSQLINGLSTVTVPSNTTLTLRDVPNPKTVSGCHWEM
ncbi:GDSL-type esterase/lipase family protein [Granulicella arctica]|uniref:Lysophospholipase L1-like esterase n=1 Tax=Granulicella arctica TaxID=940613 RepID=A0A7Y9TRX9_9BACT|nr:GDSL-type esterase/lipase family protein [Granulicella arctica]NYF78568.1 lysophospholipase L1-like esterase [Granulicella arctica]